MTDSATVRPGGESSASQAAADALMGALHRYVDGEPVDLQQPVDRLLESLAGTVSDEALTDVLTSVAAVIDRWWEVASRGTDGAATAKPLTRSLLDVVSRRLFEVLTPFGREADLIAAEKAVAVLEQRAADARSALERAVNAGDIESVLEQRAAVEVTIPGQLGKAREDLLALQLDAAKARMGPAKAIRAAQAAKVTAAAKAKDAAAEQLRACVRELTDAQAAAQNASAMEDEVRAAIAARAEELERHRAQHARTQQDRIRQLAGLAPAGA